jgi:hypothetical protein
MQPVALAELAQLAAYEALALAEQVHLRAWLLLLQVQQLL